MGPHQTSGNRSSHDNVESLAIPEDPEPEPCPRHSGLLSGLPATTNLVAVPRLKNRKEEVVELLFARKDGSLSPTQVESDTARSFCWQHGVVGNQEIGVLVAEQWAGDARFLRLGERGSGGVKEGPTFSLETGSVLPDYVAKDFAVGARQFRIEHLEQISQDVVLIWVERQEEGDQARETEHRALLTVSGLASGNVKVSDEIFAITHGPHGICYDPCRKIVWSLERGGLEHSPYDVVIRASKQTGESSFETDYQLLEMTHGHHHRFRHRIYFSPRTGHVVTHAQVDAMFGSPSDFPNRPWTFTSFWDPEKEVQTCMIGYHDFRSKVTPLCFSTNAPGEETSSLFFGHRGLNESAAAYDMRTMDLAFSLPSPGPRYDSAPCVFLPSKHECWLPLADAKVLGVVDVRFPDRWLAELSPTSGIFRDSLRAPFDGNGSVISKSGGTLQCWTSSSPEPRWTHDTGMGSISSFCIWSSLDDVSDHPLFAQ